MCRPIRPNSKRPQHQPRARLQHSQPTTRAFHNPKRLMAARVPLKSLHAAPWNPRSLRDARFQNLCKSIEADPGLIELRPILATKDGTIYGGNQRFRAVQHLGWTDVPAELSDIPEQLAKERALRDNGAWGEWVDDDLGSLLAELKDAGSDIDLLGFDSPDLDRLLKSVTQVPEEDEADLEPPVEPITKPGDLWL